MSTARETMFCEFSEDVADAAAALIHESQLAAVKERGVFRIALCGGKMSELLFNRLTDEWKEEMEWERWELFWSDERAVPPDNEYSNFGLANNLLFKHVPIKKIFRIPAEAEDINAAAAAYNAVLKKQFSSENPVFDIILLGMGSDGHTASLFPGSPLLESGSLVAVAESDSHAHKRLTFTLRTINKARFVLFMVSGERKADAAREVLVNENFSLPAARVDPKDGRVVWIIDEAAASKME